MSRHDTRSTWKIFIIGRWPKKFLPPTALVMRAPNGVVTTRRLATDFVQLGAA